VSHLLDLANKTAVVGSGGNHCIRLGAHSRLAQPSERCAHWPPAEQVLNDPPQVVALGKRSLRNL